MKNKVIRGILAVIAAIAVTFALSYGTDALMVAAGLMTNSALPDSVGLVILIIAYRTVYNAVGAFVVAKLAPSHPMRYALGLGIFGILGTLGAMSSMDSPAYYPIALAVFTLSSVWVGAKLAMQSNK